MDWEQRCKELQCRVDALERENQELRRQLGYSDSVQPAVPEYSKIETVSAAGVGAGVHMRSTPEEKICLFRSLFRGREDVFARRWYSTKTEKAGIPQSAPTNGARVFASSRKEAVQNVKIGNRFL